MKKGFIPALALLLTLGLVGCGGSTFTDATLDVAAMTVTSASINDEGMLCTACAANNGRNDPTGQNQSPDLAWDPVDEAAGYVVVMFDEDANWLHWLVGLVTDTALPQGAYNQSDIYIGPYPPAAAGRHSYRVEVFAVRGALGEIDAKMDAANSYAELVNSIDNADGNPGNILARGAVTGSYEHGDDTK